MKRYAALVWCALAVAGTLSAAPKSPRTLSIDVKDAEVRAIFATVKVQCGIRNVIIDRDVSGKGTFLFRDVPCEQAIRTITASLGLGFEIEPSYLRVAVEP